MNLKNIKREKTIDFATLSLVHFIILKYYYILNELQKYRKRQKIIQK